MQHRLANWLLLPRLNLIMLLSPRVRLVRPLIEYGGSDAGPFFQMPAALSYPMNMRLYDWGYRAVAEPALNGRSLVCPRGKVIGGSSSINGMIYVRGIFWPALHILPPTAHRHIFSI